MQPQAAALKPRGGAWAEGAGGPEGGRLNIANSGPAHHRLSATPLVHLFVGRCEREPGNWAGNRMHGWETAPETHCWSPQHVLEA